MTKIPRSYNLSQQDKQKLIDVLDDFKGQLFKLKDWKIPASFFFKQR